MFDIGLQPSSSQIPLPNAPKGHRHKAQGWPRFLRPTLGIGSISISTLKGLSQGATLAGLTLLASSPRVGREKRGQPWALRRCPFRAVIIPGQPNLEKPGLKPGPTCFLSIGNFFSRPDAMRSLIGNQMQAFGFPAFIWPP